MFKTLTLGIFGLLVFPLLVSAQSSDYWLKNYAQTQFNRDLLFKLDTLDHTLRMSQPLAPVVTEENVDRQYEKMNALNNQYVCVLKAGSGAYYDEKTKSCACGYGYDWQGKCTARDIYMKKWCIDQYGDGSFYSYASDKCECKEGYTATKNGKEYSCAPPFPVVLAPTTTPTVVSLQKQLVALQEMLKQLQAKK